VTKADIYRILIRTTKWTFDQIAELNVWQQLIVAEVDIKDTEPGTIEFATMADYNRWKAESGL
jgi:hypothetical protein